jgi:hypothetical protein
MARDPQSGSFNSKVVDEQTKAAAKRAATAAAPAAAKAIAKTPNELLLDRVNAQINKLNQKVADATPKTETAAQRLERIRLERETTQAGLNPNNPKPTEDPGPGMYWANFGGIWRKYKYIVNPVVNGKKGGGSEDDDSEDDNNEDDGTGGGKTTYTAPDGKIFTDLNAYNAYIAELEQQRKTKAGQSAYDLLFEQFNQYGMGGLVEPLKQFIQQGLSSSEFTLRLRDTDAYKKRFAANASRIAKGLSALNEAEYIGLEDQYQNIMREYGLPASYYARGDMGRQEGFEKFLANDVSAAELEDRIMTAQSRVINANPEVLASLKQFYPGISDGDILAYTLDPEKALTDIKRKVTAAEIGGAAMQAGLKTGMTRAEELAAAGITKQQAQQGFQTVAEVAPRGGQLAEIYKQSPYTQTTAEAEIFGLSGSTEAAKQRKKLTSLETAAFGGSAGAGAIARDRAGVL